MSDYALLDKSNIVIAVVRWDGDTDKWSPPPEAASWVDVSDPELFIEPGGTLDPKTLEFTRGTPPEPDQALLDSFRPAPEKAVARMDALISTLVTKGVITTDDVKQVEASAFADAAVVDAAIEKPL